MVDIAGAALPHVLQEFQMCSALHGTYVTVYCEPPFDLTRERLEHRATHLGKELSKQERAAMTSISVPIDG